MTLWLFLVGVMGVIYWGSDVARSSVTGSSEGIQMAAIHVLNEEVRQRLVMQGQAMSNRH